MRALARKGCTLRAQAATQVSGCPVSSALRDAFSVYQRKRGAWISKSGLCLSSESDPAPTFFGFDYMIYDGASEDVLREAHAELYLSCLQALKPNSVWLADNGYNGRDYITSPILQPQEQGSPLTSLSHLIHAVPSYDLFEKRVALFTYGSGGRSSYLSFRIKGDTKHIYDRPLMGIITPA